ncbi:MAG: 30S ribosomal protein S6 [Patescibacteria group bacterium]
MNSYLLTLVLKPDQDEKERKVLLDSLTKKIVGEDGKVKKEDLWGVRELSYPIKRQTKGFYAHFELDADPSSVKGLDKTLKVEEDILRYLLVRI